jgi:hypothetical protein
MASSITAMNIAVAGIDAEQRIGSKKYQQRPEIER